MLSANNLLRPQDGRPVTVPTQDMVLGVYYLTIEREGLGAGKAFSSPEEALIAYQTGDVEIHSPIKVLMKREVDGVIRSKVVNATVGRIIFNEAIPQDLGFVDDQTPRQCSIWKYHLYVREANSERLLNLHRKARIYRDRSFA